ncbi:MAG: efflux RND transporter periplasmic adaptor subunit [Gammaproteobacteria bacterium]
MTIQCAAAAVLRRLAPLLLVLLTLCPPLALAEDRATPVRTVPVETEQVRSSFVSAGHVSVKTQALSFKIPGRLIEILAEEGDQIGKGQLLARLEEIDARDQVRDSEALLDQAQSHYQRIKALFEEDKTSADEHDLALKLRKQAQVNHDQARINLERCRLHAPVDGVIGVKYFEHPGTVDAGTPIFALQRADRPWLVEIDNLTARQILLVSEGDQVEVEFAPYPDERFEGRISMVGQEADQSDGLYRLEVTVNPGRPLKPGMLAKVTLYGSTSQTRTTIPLESLRSMRGDAGHVFVPIDAGNRAARVAVTVLDVRSGRAILAEGLDYPQVISFGRNLVDGGRIEIVQ